MIDKAFDCAARCRTRIGGYLTRIRNDWDEGRKARAVVKAAVPVALAVCSVSILGFIWMKRKAIVGFFCFLIIAYSFAVSGRASVESEAPPPPPDNHAYNSILLTVRRASWAGPDHGGNRHPGRPR